MPQTHPEPSHFRIQNLASEAAAAAAVAGGMRQDSLSAPFTASAAGETRVNALKEKAIFPCKSRS